MRNPLVSLLRRDANRARRPGTGRETTKRAFNLQLPTPAAALFAGRRDAQPSGKFDDDVESLWRDSMDGAPPVTATADEVMAAAETSGSGYLHSAPAEGAVELPQEGPCDGEPTPFRRQNKLMRTPAQGACNEEEVRVATFCHG